MSRKGEILADHVYLVGGRKEEEVDAPNGMVYTDEVESLQQEFQNFLMEHLVSTLVDVKKDYPVKDTVNLKFSSDFVVMRREHFDELFREEFKMEEEG